MTSTTKKAAPPERRKTASGQQSCADSIPTTLRADGQAEQTQNRVEAEDARWRANNFCADCGAYVGDEFASCSSQKAHRRGPVWCDACTMRREVAR